MLAETHVLDSLPAYALGALEQDEARLVAEHLRGCYLCRRELAAFKQVAGHLALAVPEAHPPDELKSRLLERIQGPSPRRFQAEAKRVWPRLLPLGLITSVAVILILLVSNLLFWQRLNHLEVLSGPLGMRAVAMQNTTAAPSASGFVIISADGGNGVLVVDDLPPLDEQSQYQLWLVKDGERVSGAVFSVDETGYRGVRIVTPDSLLTYSEVLVTVEPAGGSAMPAGKQVLQGSLFNP